MVRKNFIPSVSLVRRDLPKLTTTTASSTTVSKSSSAVASQTSSTSLPSLATSLSSSKSSSSPLVIPSITPPSTAGNPFILNAGKKPNGTVYIAVGAVICAFFVCVFIWWLVSNYMARRSAMSTYAIDSKSFYKGHHKHTSSLQSNPFDINDEKSYLHDDWDSMSQLEYSQYDDTVSPFNPVQDPFADNKSKLFISPTLQVSQYEKSHSRHQSKDTNIFIDGASLYTENYMGQEEEKKLNLNRPQRAASPERKERKINSMEGYHKRNQSSLGLIPVATATSNTSSPKKAHKRQTPSMFLDDVLNGKDTI